MDRIRPSEHGKYIRPFDTKTLLVATNCIGQYEEMSMHFACIDVAIGKFRGPISGGEKKDSEEDVYLFFESNLKLLEVFSKQMCKLVRTLRGFYMVDQKQCESSSSPFYFMNNGCKTPPLNLTFKKHKTCFGPQN